MFYILSQAYNLHTFVKRIKIIAFKDTYPVRFNIIVDNILEQISYRSGQSGNCCVQDYN